VSLTRALKTIPVGQHVRPFWTCEIVACIPLQNSVALYVCWVLANASGVLYAPTFMTSGTLMSPEKIKAELMTSAI